MVKISLLADAWALTWTEQIPVNDWWTTRRTTTQEVADLAEIPASQVTDFNSAVDAKIDVLNDEEKTTPNDTDVFALWDTVRKKVTRANIKATLKTYFDGLYVALTGNQTIAWIKTFSSFPVTPSSAPTTDYQTANKKYVDDSIIPVYQHLEGVSVDTAITASDKTIVSKSLDWIAVGDIVEAEIIGNITISPWSTRAWKYTFTLWSTTIFFSDTAFQGNNAVIKLNAYFSIISTSSVYVSVVLNRWAWSWGWGNIGQVFSWRISYNESSNDETGTKTLTFYVASTDATAPQTFKLRWFKVSVLKKTP